MKKQIILIAAALALIGTLGAKENKKSKKKTKEVSGPVITASTSWSAAFADIAGVDEVTAIAPANLRHPPEYEITVSDIVKIQDSDIFIFAGFERMMQTLGTALSSDFEGAKPQQVKISLDNSIATVTSESRKIAAITRTEAENEKRLAEYIKAVEEGKKKFSGKKIRVLCNKNQTYLAKDLGFEIAGIFGPGPVTSEQILDAQENNYDMIIDNVHNPVGSPLAEVAPDAKYVIWRNFPEKVERGALLKVIQENIKAAE
ncbi:MAG: ABC transporter substrate-binding protein [Treponema sp.]|nr:ABC transporter substrate-binding protein [Treponema sp.]